MLKTITTIILLAAGVAAVPAMASTNASERRLAATESRDARQESRISNGLANDQITTREAAHLNTQQARIDTSQARLASDGNFSRRDYARVNSRQDKVNHNIARARNNRR